MDFRLGPIRITTQTSNTPQVEAVDRGIEDDLAELDAGVAFAKVDHSGNLVEVSKALGSFLSASPAALVGQSIDAIFRLSDLASGPEAGNTFQQLISQAGYPIVVEACADELSNVALVASSTQPSSAADPGERLLTFQPIGDLFKQQQKLQQQVDHIDNTQLSLLLDRDGRVLKASAAFLQTSQLELNDVKDKHLRHMLATEGPSQRWLQSQWPQAMNGDINSFPLCFKLAEKEVWFKCNFGVGQTSSGDDGVLCWLTDIDQEFSQSLRNDARINALNSGFAVATYTMDGTITEVSKGFASMLGCSPESLIGKHHSSLVDPEQRTSNDYSLFWHNLIAGHASHGLYKRLHTDNSCRWLSGAYLPVLGDNGVPVEIVECSLDISAEKEQSQQALQRIERVDANLAFIELDTDGHIKGCSPAALQMLGVSLPEVVDSDIANWLDCQTDSDDPWQALRSGKENSVEASRSFADGQPHWFKLCRYSSQVDATDNGITSYALTDITAEKKAVTEYSSKLAAINRSQAVIEFELDGTIIDANENFLATMGYQLADIRGKHHNIFMARDEAKSREYSHFWQQLAAGVFQSGEVKRLTKDGKEIWLQATYNPIFDLAGKPWRVVKFAVDITAQKHLANEIEWKMDALNRAQAMIEFDTQGTILDANENFCTAMGYQLDDIKGQNHSIFVADEDKNQDYELFWDALRRGEAQLGEVKRVDRHGSQVWLSASYNPILDANGKVCKVIKLATVVTGRGHAVEVVQRAMEAVANGDLSHPIKDSFEPEFEPLKLAINQTINTLKQIVLDISQAAMQVTSGASDIETGFNDLSMRTERQAASLEETAASMEEMTQTSKTTAANSQEANELAKQASQKAEAGGNIVSQAVSSMEAITEASRKISDIIGVIDEIAFQTNLLALNAAVEAARAGEQGRGFAVVAGEVRNLAQRSAGAAKEIKELIKDGVDKVEEGTKLVNHSGATLMEIVDAVQNASAMISRISESADEQTKGISEINNAVTEMDSMTQQNATLVKNATTSSQGLAAYAQTMLQKLSVFNIGQSVASPSSTPANPQVSTSKSQSKPNPLPTAKREASKTDSRKRAAVTPIAAADKPKVKVLQSAPVAANNDTMPILDDDDWEEF